MTLQEIPMETGDPDAQVADLGRGDRAQGLFTDQ